MEPTVVPWSHNSDSIVDMKSSQLENSKSVNCGRIWNAEEATSLHTQDSPCQQFPSCSCEPQLNQCPKNGHKSSSSARKEGTTEPSSSKRKERKEEDEENAATCDPEAEKQRQNEILMKEMERKFLRQSKCFDESHMQLQDQVESLKSSMGCKICLTSPVEVLFYPCCHLVSCDTCAGQMPRCPICRSLIKTRFRVYMV